MEEAAAADVHGPPLTITLELLRRRAEHNCGIVATLEVCGTCACCARRSLRARTQEVSLHSQNLEAVGTLLGQACPQLRILYLQNNVLQRIGARKSGNALRGGLRLSRCVPARAPVSAEAPGVRQPGAQQPHSRGKPGGV